jgi:predicted outer membrane lipoprotein
LIWEFIGRTQGCRFAPTAGLKLANAFGVFTPKLANAFGVFEPKLANAFGVFEPKLANAFGVRPN